MIEMMRSSKKSHKSLHTHGESGGLSVRSAKLASAIRNSIQESLARGLGDPRIRGLVSITGVDVSPDLTDASVKVSVIPDRFETTVLRGLSSATGRFRREIGQHARLRRVPRLGFEIDRSLKRQAELEALVQDAVPDQVDCDTEDSET